MSKIDLTAVLELSHLTVTDDQKIAFSGQLDEVIDYMSVLTGVTEVASPEYEWPIHKNVTTRQDEPVSFSHSLVAENAPDFKDGGFSVPKIG
ncbi:MAG: Asp-tRNA(Asn)/Glu-tRNA(Gln) amidotransferase subunit GatC [Candidatus Marinamargulisbacteria bacterium]